MDNPDEILVAKEAFAAPGTHVAVGDRFRAGDPIVAGREHLFTPLAASVRASVPGVPVSPPPFLVGESGSETFTPDADGQIVSADDTRDALDRKPKRGGKVQP